jgi:hypothetical protein
MQFNHIYKNKNHLNKIKKKMIKNLFCLKSTYLIRNTEEERKKEKKIKNSIIHSFLNKTFNYINKYK